MAEKARAARLGADEKCVEKQEEEEEEDRRQAALSRAHDHLEKCTGKADCIAAAVAKDKIAAITIAEL